MIHLCEQGHVRVAETAGDKVGADLPGAVRAQLVAKRHPFQDENHAIRLLALPRQIRERLHDRLHADELPLTHDFPAPMRGVRPPGITTSVHILEGAGMIKASRGRVRVLDRDRLKELAGDTYGIADAEYDRLLAEA